MQVLPAMNGGGVERGVIDVAAALVQAGWRAIVASAGGPLVRDLMRAGATHVTLPIDARNPFLVRRNARLIAAAAREHDVSLIHARSRAPAWAARGAARSLGVPFVTTFHGWYSHSNPAKRYYNSIMLKGDRVIAISQFIAKHIRTVYRINDDRIVTIPRGVDSATFDPAAVSAPRLARLSKAWRLPDGVPVIMLPGRLTRWKGQRVLLEALPRLRHRDFVCVIIGGSGGHPRYARELEDLVAERQLERHVRFVDHESDMAAAYMLADVVVSASTDPEAFGRVSAEAQAMGRPVVATSHGGTMETVMPGETGWLVPPNDPDLLATYLDQALDLDSAAREVLARRARTHILRNFSLQGMCAATLDVYRSLVFPKAPR
ncbi:MAG: glycosyltransferase [Alphaproteobacteria bacterium]|nr:glycosyltransferase [Alphaproteobacteria bacterium]